jgi:hypothetical protein
MMSSSGIRRVANHNIVYYINPSVINSDGRGAAAFGQPAFSGEVFFDNGPGQFGTLARSTINGPMFTELDMSFYQPIHLTVNPAESQSRPMLCPVLPPKPKVYPSMSIDTFTNLGWWYSDPVLALTVGA